MNPIEQVAEQLTKGKVKMPKMKLKPFAELQFDHIEIAIQRFSVAGTGDSTAYGAIALAWVSSAKTDDFPVAIRLPIAGPCYTQVAYAALQAVVGLCDSVSDQIIVGDDESGEELFTLSADDVVEDYLSCEDCSNTSSND